MTAIPYDPDEFIDWPDILGQIERATTAGSFEDEVADRVDEERFAKYAERQLAALTDEEREVLRLRFGLEHGKPQTLEQVGKVFGFTRQRAHQIEKDALNKLRTPLPKITTKLFGYTE